MGKNAQTVETAENVVVMETDTEEEEAEEERINIIVEREGSLPLIFLIYEHVPFESVFATYCKRFEIDRDDFRFYIDGEEIHDENTPEDFRVLDGDSIICAPIDDEDDYEDC